MTRMVFVGEPTEKMYRAWEAMRSANEAAEAELRSGKTGAEIHELAEAVLAEGGFANTMGHGLGHSLGIDIHEDPAIRSRCQPARCSRSSQASIFPMNSA